MKTKRWLRAFCFSVIFHTAVLAVVTYGFSISAISTETPEKKYIEIELGEAPSAGQAVENQEEAKVQETAEQRSQVPIAARNERAVMSSSAATDEPAVRMTEPGNTGLASGGTVGSSSGAVVSSGSSVSSEGVTGARGNGRNGKGDNDRPYVVYDPTPQYPNQARKNNWEGTVRVKVLIAESGIVQDILLARSSGYSSLDQAALDGVRRWRFKPAYQDGCPVTAWVIVPVIFELN